MEEYPEEIRTPPVSLVALIGCTDYHSLISSHLHSEQPPINTLALPDFSKLSLLLASNDNKPHPLTAATSDRSAVSGILKKDWLLKHRTKIPAVVAALFSSDQLFADSAQWLQVSSDLDNLKSLIRPKNIKLAVVVLHLSSDEISEDRMTALRKQAELDSKYIVVFNPSEVSQLEQSLNRIAGVFAELSNIYYRDEGKRIKTSVEKKNSNSNELNVRYCFKVAVYAEFRRDWAEALRFYEDAYHILREMIGTATRLPVIQRLVEIKTVAEQLHFKISTLLLHGGKLGDAVMWFCRHITSYRKLVGLSEAVFLHWEWISRQYLAFAELLETSSKSMQGNLFPALGTGDNALTEWEFQPAYYYQLAAHYLKEKRNSLEVALSMSVPSDEMDNNAESVVPSIYVGQFARLLEEGDAAATQVLTDEEYTQYAISEGKRFQDSFEIIALLKKSQDLFSSVKSHRMSSLCGFQMAREYFTVGDFSNAKQIFDGVANIYRQEGWVTLLWEALGYLRECSRKSGMTQEFVEYSLEMAALPVLSSSSGNQFKITECGPAGPASLEQREIIHAEVFGLVGGAAKLVQDENNNLKFSRDHPLHLEIDLVSPLRLALLASVAFHEQVIKPGVPTLFTLSLLTQLPLPVEIDQLEVQFNQSECNFIITNSQKSISAAVSKSQLLRRVETAPSLDLVTNKWQRLTYEIKSELAGKLECTYVIAKTGPHFTICCRAESPASMDALPLWKFEDRLETFPTKDPSLSFSGQKAVQVEELDPQVDLILGATGPALAGECFYVPVTVASKGHSVFSGELKFNLVDAGGGGLFSPSRETEPFSSDSHHVELVGIALPEEDESQSSPDKIDKLQDSFGLVSVPTLEAGESWSCRLQIKWHRPKPIMLYASLGYFSGSSGAPSQKVRVHRSMQIEGKTPVVLSHNLMLPFRRDSLLLSKLKLNPGTNQLASIPLNETGILVVTAKNCSEVPLKIQSLSIDAAEGTERSFVLLNGDKELQVPAKLLPGEEFKKVFTVRPEEKISKFHLGSVSLRWRRDSVSNDQSASATTDSWVLTKHQLPEINVELPLLVVNLECPPYAILGDPFTYLVKIQNHTQLLQEVKFSLADAQPFVSSGSHSDTIFILPKSVYTLRYMVVPLASGMHQLPRVTITSVRYSAGFQPSAAATSVFVFPSKPQFKLDDTADKVKKPMLADTV